MDDDVSIDVVVAAGEVEVELVLAPVVPVGPVGAVDCDVDGVTVELPDELDRE